jgi:BirA family biotin operon repressor/biotin-[acetyl-CoA-carboxylase] ligase
LGALGASIKWPNDVLADRRKLAGILAELRAPDGTPELVIGTGFNIYQGLRDFPSELAERATSLRLCVDGPLSGREAVAERYLSVLGEIAERLQLGDWASVRSEWERFAPESRSRRVRVVGAGGTSWIGVTRGIDPTGALLVERADGETVSIHDVDSVRALEE